VESSSWCRHPWPTCVASSIGAPIRIKRRFPCASPARLLTPELGQNIELFKRRPLCVEAIVKLLCRDSQVWPLGLGLVLKQQDHKPSRGTAAEQTIKGLQGHASNPCPTALQTNQGHESEHR